ncbi:hypothetical protein, partial [Acinetobacter baumannii]|uniref:hypothetical protein n=1 Tax=Acinetobacter baumannii TaxID=470 RepID=UPI001488A1EA
DVAAAQAKVDALNKTFSGMSSAKAALDAAVAEEKDAQSWVMKAQASVALANKGQDAFNQAVKNKDPAAAGFTDFTAFKNAATSGLANAQARSD